MIDFSDETDKSELIALYNHCFPGENDFCLWYFDCIWKTQNTLVYRENGVILGMLQMLPLDMEYEKTIVKSAYLYALGTYSHARGKGIMSSLINKSFEICVHRGQKLSVLITENDTLFDYYARYGYKPAFYISKCSCSAEKLPCGFYIRHMEQKDYCKVNMLYNEAATGILHGIRYKKHFETMFEIFGVNAWVLCDQFGEVCAYAYAEQENDRVIATECLSENAEILMSGLAYELDCRGAEWKGVATPENCTPQGCIFQLVPMELPEKSYLNLMYN